VKTRTEKAQVRKKIRREYGPAEGQKMMSGLAAAAKEIYKEEQLFLRFDGKGKPVN
jgi:hypothetical protein